MGNNTIITIETKINSEIEKVWQLWTLPEHIINWCFASDDWCAPAAENDIVTGGKFKTVMAARDGSMSFDFEGIYSEVIPLKLIKYSMADGRTVEIHFSNEDNFTKVIESFEAETTNSLEMQQAGWQSILDNFKKYVENN
jgi:uncharacterized protein YndB with AHSA1/START domain